MYRIASDVEKLPFPMAPVGAQGVMALADASSGKETWRWRVFSFGGMLGIAFGAVYFAMPAVTGAMLGTPIQIFPLPFFDGTPNTEDFLPAVPMMLSFDLGIIIAGMVLPFWAMVGSFIALVVCLAANPILHHTGILQNWSPGVGAVRTIQVNTLDFYFSFGLGLLAAIAVIGFWHVIKGVIGSKKEGGADWKALLNPPIGRGDFSIWLALGIYFVTMAITILVAYLLLQNAHAAGDGLAGHEDPCSASSFSTASSTRQSSVTSARVLKASSDRACRFRSFVKRHLSSPVTRVWPSGSRRFLRRTTARRRSTSARPN